MRLSRAHSQSSRPSASHATAAGASLDAPQLAALVDLLEVAALDEGVDRAVDRRAVESLRVEVGGELAAADGGV